MSYCNIDESDDIMIKITDDDAAAADRYVDALLVRIGVKAPLTGEIPYEVSQLALAEAHRRRALLLSGPGGGMGENDAYMAKYKAYVKEVSRWEMLITPELLKGAPQHVFCIDLGRA